MYPFRTSEEDEQIIEWLQSRLGISVADVLRLGLRALKKQEERNDK
jgi:hypothetical protein